MSNEYNDEKASESKLFELSLGADLIIPVLALGLFGYFLVSTISLPWTSKAVSIIVGSALSVLVFIQIVTSLAEVLKGQKGLGFGRLLESSPTQFQRLVIIVTLALFIALIDVLGTTLGLFLASMIMMAVMGVRSLPKLTAIALGISAAVYGIFILFLGLRLPQGPFETALSAIFG
ncbi:MAG: hypothetical protein CMF72_16300 [Mameliella sp.]|nr:hypothetical protein [Mameliella sp.]|tara:strand:+ start:1662 stop:2189 length:528 start_codon:yes stop_codon:yes gene_type:complete